MVPVLKVCTEVGVVCACAGKQDGSATSVALRVKTACLTDTESYLPCLGEKAITTATLGGRRRRFDRRGKAARHCVNRCARRRGASAGALEVPTTVRGENRLLL